MRHLRRPIVGLARSLLARSFLFGLQWWAFKEGEIVDPSASTIAVLAVVAISYLLIPVGAHRLQVVGVLRFLPFFVRESVRGGTDVAARAFHPRLPVVPGFVEHPLRLSEGPGRVFFITAVSLLPGTLSAELRGGVLRVHLLHRGLPARNRIAELEDRVAAVFALRTSSDSTQGPPRGSHSTGPGA